MISEDVGKSYTFNHDAAKGRLLLRRLRSFFLLIAILPISALIIGNGWTAAEPVEPSKATVFICRVTSGYMTGGDVRVDTIKGIVSWGETEDLQRPVTIRLTSAHPFEIEAIREQPGRLIVYINIKDDNGILRLTGDIGDDGILGTCLAQ